MPAVSRKGDSLSTGHICTSTTTLDTPGQSTVFANSILVARIGDPTVDWVGVFKVVVLVQIWPVVKLSPFLLTAGMFSF